MKRLSVTIPSGFVEPSIRYLFSSACRGKPRLHVIIVTFILQELSRHLWRLWSGNLRVENLWGRELRFEHLLSCKFHFDHLLCGDDEI